MNKTTLLRGAGITLLASLSALGLPTSPASATSLKRPVTALISVATDGKTGNDATPGADLSGLGRFAAFSSAASNFVAGDTNNTNDVFVRNTLDQTTTRVSVSTLGTQANGPSDSPSISYNGRWVAFRSAASNLVAGDTNGQTDIFVRDLQLKTTKRVSVANVGSKQLLNGGSAYPQISYDGNEVLFESDATNVVDWDLNNKTDVFVRNISGDYTQMQTLTNADGALSSGGNLPRFSGDGRFVVFSSSTTQIGLDTNGVGDVFLRDRKNGTTEKVSTASNGDQSDGNSQSPDVSDNGRFITFTSMATDLTPAVDAPAYQDVFRRDRILATTELVTRNGSNQPANKGGGGSTVSSDGTKVAIDSDSTNLVSGDTNNLGDVFVRDLAAGTTTRTSIQTSGGQLDGMSFSPTISPDGTASAFATMSTKGYDKDTNGTFDTYVRHSNEVGPFADTTGVIQQNAKDFIGGPLPIGQLVALNDRVLYGVAGSESTIDDFAHGFYDDHRGPIMRLYWAFFLRMPDLNGLNFWTAKEAGPMTLRQVATAFAKSPEFKTKYGSLSNSAFVTLVYQSVLERNPDAAGLAHWVDELGKGVTRGEMMVGFSESAEGVRRMRAEVDTVLISLGMLKRLPTKGEFAGYVASLEVNGGQPTEVLIFNILTGAEYANRIN